MSSLTNINNNSSVVNVGRTTPVSPGQQTADKSIPVVVASDQSPIPVVEQNKIQSEVSLSLLGIPRAEVALGIFADVNTYDVNPNEWSASPAEYTLDSAGNGWGIKHLPEEAGALVEAPKDKFSVLTSKRFFRYQPGRVSAATFGIKSTVSPASTDTVFDLNPAIRKYGIFDKYDGYYWETRSNPKIGGPNGAYFGDNFSIVRRTQSLLKHNPIPYGSATNQYEDHGLTGKAPNVYSEPPNASPTATKYLIDNRFKIIETAFAAAEGADTAVANLSSANKLKCKRDMNLALQAYILDLQYGGNAHSIVNATTYSIAQLNNTTAETTVHTQLRSALVTALNSIGETAAAGRIYTNGATSELARWTINAVGGTQPTQSQINSADYGSRSGISTVFSIYSKFLAYIASEYSYDLTETNIVTANSYNSTNSTLAADEIKYRCYRDITYILKGYAEDLEFDGNASTIYNAKRYYFNGIQVYSQDPAGLLGEIKRHKFIKKLLTENASSGQFDIPTVSGKTFTSLTSLFPNVFNSTLRNKLITLANLIIDNFSTEYVGDITYGSGGNFGDLVVLRDGLVMTHAAIFDASLLKETKNVVVKPGFVVKTTGSGTSGASTITVASNNGIAIGMSVAASATGIPSGTVVAGISGTTITLSANLSASLAGGTVISFGDSTLETSQEQFVVGQYINFYGTSAGANANSLSANKLYKVERVRGPLGNIITLSDPTVKNSLVVNITGTTLTVTSNPDNVVLSAGTKLVGKGLVEGTTIISGSGTTFTINSAPSNNLTGVTITVTAVISPDVDPTNPTLIYINPNVPFVFPSVYFTGTDDANTEKTPFKRPDGMFPLMYTRTGALPAGDDIEEKVGFIDTSIIASNPNNFKAQIDNVNLMYNNWVKQNVDPRYYSVYEYRIPRSRFSTDQLNGTVNNTVFSDVATGESGGRAYPGQTVTKNSAAVQNKSVWEIDFTKVSMLKIEFSWYGAVGALFLAYVPVGNGEARWVRVHHLRASNQLKISSLGNATLPITYFVYGGGSVNRLGIADNTSKGYTKSDHIVKYGASYYIDGGDRGTVRLYSYSTYNNVDIYGSSYTLGNLTLSSDSIGAYINVSGVSNLPSDKRFFMKAKLITNSKTDQNVEIVWVDGNKLYLNKNSLDSTNGLVIIANRPSIVFGLKAKENILNASGKGVRNRVQVYPTKLSTSSIAPDGVTTPPKIKLQILKTPLYQANISTSGSFTLSSAYDITSSNLPLPTSSTTYLSKDGQGIYGWFRANVGTVFGYLYKNNGNYYFNLLETYSVQVTLLSGIGFLAEGLFDFSGTALSGQGEGTIQKERLSSVFVSTQVQAPIPGTGTEVATFFLKEGADMFDLLTYFDYNKDYLSFPLTNKIESIYLAATSIQPSTGNPVAEISSSLTWEEQ